MQFRAVILFAFSPIVLAQTGAPSDSTMQSLLAEVRQLRVTLERSMTLWPQAQLVLQRAQLQQQRVESLSRQLEQLRDQLARSAAEAGRLGQQIKRFEDLVVQEQDARRRQEFESQVKNFKMQLDGQALRDQQQQAREGQLAGQLQAEQSKLVELNDRMDALERMLQAASPPK